jgi:excisionase family DNA binding protein
MTTADASPQANSAKLLDVRAVAELLGCSPRHVYRMADAGKIVPPVRIGALVRWKANGPGSIQEWLDGGCEPVRSNGRKGAMR